MEIYRKIYLKVRKYPFSHHILELTILSLSFWEKGFSDLIGPFFPNLLGPFSAFARNFIVLSNLTQISTQRV